MIIDLDKARDEFVKFVSDYDLTNSNIERKVFHSARVMAISHLLAEKMNLSKEDTDLAALIGLLHDLGRFDQVTKYQTFCDFKSFDHGDYGVEILNKDIRKYIESPEYDNIIKAAVKNHNKYSIEDGLTDKELFFAKLVRDADKLDILYESTCMFWENKEDEIYNSKVVPEVLDSFYNKILIKNDAPGSREGINSIISELAIVYDLNYKESFEILKSRHYISDILKRFDYPDKALINNVEKTLDSFVDSKL